MTPTSFLEALYRANGGTVPDLLDRQIIANAAVPSISTGGGGGGAERLGIGLFYLARSYATEPPIIPADIPGVTNSHMKGILWRQTWDRLNPSGTGNNFAFLDACVAASNLHGKLSAFQIEPGINSPQWFYDAYPSEILHLTDPGPLLTTVPWGPNFKTFWRGVQEDLAGRYKAYLSYVIIQGLGRASETFLVNSTDEAAAIALAQLFGYDDLRDAFTTSVAEQIDMMVEVWDPVPVVMVTGTPYPTGGVADLQSMFDYGDGTYPGKFGARANNLSSNGPDPGEPGYDIIQQISPNCTAVGYQFANEQLLNDPHPPEHLDTALRIGTTYGHFIEVFKGDADDGASGPVLDDANTRMLAV